MSDALNEQLKRLESLILGTAATQSNDFTHKYSTSLMLALKALLDCRDVPTWLKSTDGRVLYLNPSYCKRYKVDPPRVLGNLETDNWNHPCSKQWAENDQKVLATGRQQVFTENLPDGQEIHCRKWLVQFDGEVIGVAGEVIDGSNFA